MIFLGLFLINFDLSMDFINIFDSFLMFNHLIHLKLYYVGLIFEFHIFYFFNFMNYLIFILIVFFYFDLIYLIDDLSRFNRL
jgi:hypothetical protein